MYSASQFVHRFLDNLHFIFQPRRKPLLTARIVHSMLSYLVHSDRRKRPIRNIDIALSYACNLTCKHCSCERLKSREQVLTIEQYRKLAKEAFDLGVIYFSFTGGEPVLNSDLENIIQIFYPKHCLIGLQTNALLLNKDRIDSLYSAGVDALQVSLDSGNPKEHDSFRQSRGAHSETIKNINNALSKGIRVIISSTITHSNIRSKGLVELLQYCHSLKLPIVISVPCPVGKWTNYFSEQLNEDDRQYLAQLQKRFPQLRRDFHSNYFRMGCSAATEKLYITPHGDVIPCPFIHISFGSVKEESLGNIRERMLKVDRFNEYNQTCLAGEDQSFIDQYIRPTYQAEHLPQRWINHPILSKSCQ